VTPAPAADPGYPGYSERTRPGNGPAPPEYPAGPPQGTDPAYGPGPAFRPGPTPGPGPSARPRHRRPAPDDAFARHAGPVGGSPQEGPGYAGADAAWASPDGFSHPPPRHGFASPDPYQRPHGDPSTSGAAQHNGAFHNGAFHNGAAQNGAFQDAAAPGAASEEWSSYDEPDELRTSDEPEDESRTASEKKLEQLKELYLTAEAIGEENVDKHWDELLQRQRDLITGYFKDSGFAVPDSAVPDS